MRSEYRACKTFQLWLGFSNEKPDLYTAHSYLLGALDLLNALRVRRVSMLRSW